jgi:phage-related minor tail protein
MAKAIVVEILGDASHFANTLDKAAGRTRQFGRVAGVVGTAIAGGLALGLERSVAAAVDAQDSQRRLSQAFKITGLSLDSYKGSIDAAQESGRKLGFSDTEVRDSLGSLVTATGNVKTSMKDLKVAQDLARFTGKDLTSTTKFMTSAMTGSQRAIKALGLSVIPVTTHVDALKRAHVDLTTVSGKARLAHAKMLDKMATGKAVVEAATKATKGQAKAFSDTAAGGMEEFKAQLDHLEVGLGKGLLPALSKVVEWIGKLVGFLADHQTLAKVFAAGLAVLAAALMGVAAATTIVELAMSPLLVPVLAITAALVVLGAAIYEGIKHWGDIKAAMSDLWGWITNTFLGVWDTVKTAMSNVTDWITGTALGIWTSLLNGIKAVKDWVKNNWAEIATLLSGPFALILAPATNAFGVRDKLMEAFTAVKNWASARIDDIVNFFTGLGTRIWAGFSGGWNAIKENIRGAFDAAKGWASSAVDGIVGFFRDMPGRIGTAIANGAKELKDAVTGLFGKVIGWVKGVFGISSPSTVFEEIGKNVIRGFVKGAGGMAGMLKDYVVGLAKSLIPSFSAPTGSGLVSGTGGLVGRVLNALNYARQMGWHGEVISGFRTYAEQAALYARYLAGGPIAAKPGTSSHERGEAVDVSDAGRFDTIMAGAPPGSQLFNNVPGDFNHFSVSGRALGGPVVAGRPYLVGERGMELFTPSSNGAITPNHMLGAGDIVINLTATLDGEPIYQNQKRYAARDVLRNGGTGISA